MDANIRTAARAQGDRDTSFLLASEPQLLWSSHKVPMNLLINNHYFCIYLPFLLGEVVSSSKILWSLLGCRLDSFNDEHISKQDEAEAAH